MSIQIRETQALAIPPEHLDKPISPQVLELFGVRGEVDQIRPELCPVVVEGVSKDNGAQWYLIARCGRPEEKEVYFGSAELGHESNEQIAPADVLEAGERWVRASQNTAYVPGDIVPLRLPNALGARAVAGLLLVRACDCIA